VSEANDEELVRQALAGALGGYDVLAARHRPGLVRFAVRMVGDADEAESLAQETLARALARLGDFDPARNLGAWLRGIAVNLCRNHLRDRARHARPVDPDRLLPAPAAEGRRRGVLSGVLRRELHKRLQEAIDQLPLAYKEAFVLHYLEGLDYADISEVTGVSAGALRARALRARALMRDSLGAVVDTWLRTQADGGGSAGSP
jgi:RNA polymerase sigma-70 factor (ECF subfamily)